MPDTIEQWKIDVLKVLGEKATVAEQTPTRGGMALNAKRTRDHRDVLPTVNMPGNGPPTGRVGRFLGGQLFGSRTDRRARNPDKLRQITEMHDKGTAAPVEFVANGRTLKGNFFSAKGHNLKNENLDPDTSRPVVLLLTGSGGSAEDQGLDVAKMYAEGGANVLSVNYGGYGDSEDSEVSEQSLNQDGQAMLQYLVGLGYDPDKIVLHGYSMGATVSAQLESVYERNGVQFRGQVQDRPMPSAYDGVMGHLGNVGALPGTLAKKTVGSMSAKKALLGSDTTTPKVVTTDSEGEFARRGELHRQGLKQGGHTVTGAPSTGGHFDHDKMIETNRDPLLDLVRKDRTGNVDPNAKSDTLDLQVIFEETMEQALATARSIPTLMSEGTSQKDLVKLNAAMQKCGDVATMIDQMHSTGLENLKDFKSRFMSLDAWGKNLDSFREKIRKAVKDISGQDPFAEKELLRIAGQIASLNYQFSQAGGAKEENKAIEDKVLAMVKLVQDLLLNVPDRRAFAATNKDLIDCIKEISAYKNAIEASRAERVRALKDSTSGLATLTGNPSTIATDAKRTVEAQMAGDFKKLEAEDEDVTAKRLIGRSSDKGFKKAVVQPVANILPKIKALMQQGQKIDNQTLPELDTVKNGLTTALALYTQKRDATDQRKNRKDWDQRDTKVKAIQERLDGLNGLIDKANNLAAKIDQKMLAQKDATLDDLEKSGGKEMLKTMATNLNGAYFANTGDANADLASRNSAKQSAEQASKYLMSCDKFQREVLLKAGLDAKGLGLVLMGTEKNSEDAMAEAVMDALGDDPDAMEDLLNKAAESEFARTVMGTKAFRENSVVTKLQVKYAAANGGSELGQQGADEFLAGSKNQDLEIKPNVLNDPAKLQQNLAKHADIFRRGLRKLLKQSPPPAVARLAAKIYAAALPKCNSPDEALEYVGGFVILRIVAPKMYSADFGTDVKGKRASIVQTKILQNLANNKHFHEDEMKPFNALIDELHGAMKAYLKSFVTDGDAHNEGFTPNDLAEEALASRATVQAAFADPGPNDPLGTEPSEPGTMLGRAIAQVRDQRDRSYDWNSLTTMKTNNPKNFDDLLYAERSDVLRLVVRSNA